MTNDQQDGAVETCACGHGLLLHDGGEECTAPGCPCAWFHEGRPGFTNMFAPPPVDGGATTTTPADEDARELTAHAFAYMADPNADWSDWSGGSQTEFRAAADQLLIALAARAVPPAQPTTGQDTLREQVARKLFREFITGAPEAWEATYGSPEHYRDECYRVADELLLALVPQPTTADDGLRQRIEALADLHRDSGTADASGFNVCAHCGWPWMDQGCSTYRDLRRALDGDQTGHQQ